MKKQQDKATSFSLVIFFSTTTNISSTEILKEKSVRKDENYIGFSSAFCFFTGVAFNSTVFEKFMIISIRINLKKNKQS